MVAADEFQPFPHLVVWLSVALLVVCLATTVAALARAVLRNWGRP